MAKRQERHQKKLDNKTKKQKKKASRKKLAKSTKISLSILAVMILLIITGTIFFFQKYGKEVTAAIDAGEEHAAKIQESDFKQHHPTTILDKNGQTIKELKTQERDYLTYKKMDPLVSQALISIEDKRFYEHHGVDTQGLLTIALNAATGKGVRGASTITQQLVKNIYLTPEVSISRKVEEMVMAQALEKRFTKHQILEYYLNNVYFGHGAYGINAAAKVYFGQSINDTSLLEKATLIGVTNNPGIFDPTTNKQNALKRAKLILKEMNAQGYITNKQYEKAVADDFTAKIHSNALNNQLDSNEVALAVDSAAKVLMGQQDFRFQYQFDSKEEEERYNKEYKVAYNKVYQRIISGGYQISTNIDTALHDQLQSILSNTMNAWQDRGENSLYTKQAAMTVIDNQTGNVVASIGGRGEEGNNYNRAFLSYRQPGSAIKPLVSYAPAYERGLLETTTVSDDRPNSTYPNNVYNASKGNLTLRNALAISSNVVAYKLAEENRTELKEPIYQPLAQMQFTGLDVGDDNPIIAVGGMTYGATTQEMASGIATLVNQGNYRAPLNINTIKRKDTGQEIFTQDDLTQQKIYSDDAAYLTIDTMKAVHQNADGTAASLNLAHNQYWAVKTGTTDEAKDLWTVGATPYYTVAVWAGDDTPQPQDNASVGQATKEIFKQTMDLLNNGKEDVDFQMPASVQKVDNQLVTRSSQTKQVLETRKNALQAATANIDTLAKQKANELTAAKLNTPMVEEASTFSNQLISERIDTLSQLEIIVTDTQDNWQIFDQYAQQVFTLIQQVEPSGGSLSDQYTNVYRNKEVEYAHEKAERNSELNTIKSQISEAKTQSKDLDKQISELKKQLDEARD
ncbi:transglycosylase domain-containing protein [Enterococcus xiangfangensis]|uniref:transglycosylase domain-containing protein n=1 Tax=Enterococcus xiangfangensis TaxID=1296537 RepID=UPI0010F85059|nr:transglycosylase domain-containing protein [Enterococcus xiangfangensis]MBM7710951.1 penicillin-binding protein 1A [Enterococcus xiangfangensis]NBK07850.1 penicillin-binding protein [Enterococcus asini]